MGTRRDIPTGHRDTLGRVVKKSSHTYSQALNHADGHNVRGDFLAEQKVPMDIPDDVMELCETLADHGISPMMVGGCVRDAILGVESKDIDIEIHGAQSVEHITNILDREGILANTVGKSFGVIKIPLKSGEVDMSLPRRDSRGGNTGNAHKDIEVQVDPGMSMEEAALRRDFTFNALMTDPFDGTLYDYYGGLNDIATGTIRAVDDNSFSEDPLRVLRAVQFAARFNFAIDDHTRELCIQASPQGLSDERVAGEMRKILLKSTSFNNAVEESKKLGKKWETATLSLPSIVNGDPVDQKALDALRTSTSLTESDKAALAVSYLGAHYGNVDDIADQFRISHKEKGLSRKIPLHLSGDQHEYSLMLRQAHERGIDPKIINTLSQSLGVTPAGSVWGDGPPEPYRITGKYLIEQGEKPGIPFSSTIEHFRNLQDRGIPFTDSEVTHYINTIKE